MKNDIYKIFGVNYELFVRNFADDESSLDVQFHPNELARVQSITNKALLQQRSIAYSLLKSNSDFWVMHTKNGAPFLMQNDVPVDFSVSFSHKKNSVAAAISTRHQQSIGIDLEILNTQKDFNFLKDKMIATEESYYLDNVKKIYHLSDKDSPLFFWILKEAAFKALRGEFDISDFRIRIQENEIILTCIRLNKIFISEVIVSDNNLIAVVMTDDESDKINTE